MADKCRFYLGNIYDKHLILCISDIQKIFSITKELNGRDRRKLIRQRCFERVWWCMMWFAEKIIKIYRRMEVERK